MKYYLTNSGSATTNFAIMTNVSWINVEPKSGSIYAGNLSEIDVSLNVNANRLPPGTYTGKVYFNNTVSGIGNTSRDITVIVNDTNNVSKMAVYPLTGTTFSGSFGGPFIQCQ